MKLNEYAGLLGTIKLRAYFREVELLHKIAHFTYVYSEDSNDTCTLTINALKTEDIDLPEFQEQADWRLVWGYATGQEKMRKLVVADVKWEMNKDGRKLTLELNDKAHTTKQTKSKQIHKGVTLPHMVAHVAGKHGLKPVIEVPGPALKGSLKNPDGTWAPETSPISVTASLDEWAKLEKKYGEQSVRQHYLTHPLTSQQEESYEQHQRSKMGVENMKAFLEQQGFKNYPNLPQATKTDFQVLQEVGRKEPKGEWIVETRDDKLILKKRDFSKKPHKSYTYNGGDGDLFSFTPESKNKSKLGSAVNSLLSYWDKQNKKFIQEQTDLIRSNEKTMLAKYLKNSGFMPSKLTVFAANEKDRKNLTIDKIVDDVVDGNDSGKGVVGEMQLPIPQPFGRRGALGSAADNTSRYIMRPIVQVTGEELKKNTKQATETVTNMFHNDTVGNTPGTPEELSEEAKGPASNSVGRNNLQRNPATALIWGDTDYETGETITILNVGKKYSGNYYVVKSTHTMGEGEGYTVNLELTRHGSNTKVGDNDASAKAAKKAVNTEVGQTGRKAKTRTIRSTSNRR